MCTQCVVRCQGGVRVVAWISGGYLKTVEDKAVQVAERPVWKMLHIFVHDDNVFKKSFSSLETDPRPRDIRESREVGFSYRSGHVAPIYSGSP